MNIRAVCCRPLQSLFPAAIESPKVAVLTPGIYNSAYYEHAFLAQQMGVELVEGSDLVSANNSDHDAHHQGIRAGRCVVSAHR